MAPWLRGTASTGLTHLGHVKLYKYVLDFMCVHVRVEAGDHRGCHFSSTVYLGF